MTQPGENRPVFLNLLQIRLPITGIISILHRVSGALLFLAIPLSLWLLQASLASERQYQYLISLAHHPLAMLIVMGLLWTLLHHLLAGIRHLLLDFDIGVEKEASVRSAWVVMLAPPVLTLLLMLRIYL